MNKLKIDMHGDPNGCWRYLSPLNTYGYGQVTIRENIILAHRVMWNLFWGRIPTNQSILHNCHNRQCVNPFHMRIGTKKENYADAKKLNRHSHGIKHGNAKLSPIAVKYIRASLKTQKELARSYGVSQSTIWSVLEKKTWRNI